MTTTATGNLVIYSMRPNPSLWRLIESLAMYFPEVSPEICIQPDQLKNRFQTLGGSVSTVIIVAHEQSDLDSLIPLVPLLEGPPILLVLPDCEAETIAKAHRFRPRFLTYKNADFTDIVSVAEKIFRYRNQRKSPRPATGLESILGQNLGNVEN